MPPKKTLTITKTSTITSTRMLTATLALALANAVAIVAPPLESSLGAASSFCPVETLTMEQRCGENKYSVATIQCGESQEAIQLRKKSGDADKCLPLSTWQKMAAEVCKDQC